MTTAVAVDPAVERLELSLIASDANDALQAMLAHRTHPDTGSIALLAFPAAGFVAEESHAYLTQRGRPERLGNPEGELFEHFHQSIKKVRARLKLFDDTDGGAAGLVAFMELVRERSEILFAHPTSKWLQLLSRPFRPDLGVFFVRDRLVATTHASIPAMGFTPESLQELRPGHFSHIHTFFSDFSRSIGGHFANLSGLLSTHGFELVLDPEPARIDFSVTHNDFVGRRLYRRVERAHTAIRSDQVAALTLCLAQVNTALHVLPALLGERSNLVLRVQYLAAYHATNTLRMIFGALPKEIDPGPSTLVSVRPLRNLLAHYELRGASRFALGASAPLQRAVEGIAGIPIERVVPAIHEQLERISDFLSRGMSKSVLKPLRAVLGEHT